MNREQIWTFIEDYRDGMIDEDAAAELARLVRGGGRDADWVIDELAFSGWVEQALQNLDEAGFVRSFLERLRAETGEADFTQAFSRRLAAETQKIKQRDEESRLKMPFRQLLGSSSAARLEKEAAGPGRRLNLAGRLKLLAAVCLLGLGIGAALLLIYSGPEQVAGTFLEVGSGVTFAGDAEEPIPAVAGGEIRAGQRVLVPLNGHAVINDFGNGRWRLNGGAKAVFMPRDVDPGHLTVPDTEGIFLEGGVMAGEIPRTGQGLMYVTTPHATAEFTGPVSFTFSVAAGSTFAEVDAGNLILTRKSDGRTLELQQGQYAVAAGGAEFEALEK